MSLKRRRAAGAPDLRSNLERIDVLMRSVYGRTLHQYQDEGMNKAYQYGYKQGIKAGRRLAKGKPEFPETGFLKSRGAPKLLGHELLRRQFIDFVNDWMREERVSLPAAVSKYRDVMKRAWRGVERVVPDQEQLLRLYKRDKRATRLKR
jgi:hypothetical protein